MMTAPITEGMQLSAEYDQNLANRQPLVALVEISDLDVVMEERSSQSIHCKNAAWQ